MGESIKFPTPGEPADYAKTIKQVVRERYGDKKVDAIVMAFPSAIDKGVAVWAPNIGHGWVNVPVHRMLHDILPGVPVLIENDVKLAGLGEARAMHPVPGTAMYISISTGIGVGLIEDGRIDKAMRKSEAGHMFIEYNGRVQRYESFASGRAIVEVYKKFAREIKSKRVWRQIADRISRGLLVLIPIIQPDYIIFGGSVGTYYERYGEYLQEILTTHLPDHIPCPKLVQAKHPEEAVVYGCYYYGIDYLADKAATKR
jgi:predicted NBD/HSP70 family sugar kinase